MDSHSHMCCTAVHVCDSGGTEQAFTAWAKSLKAQVVSCAWQHVDLPICQFVLDGGPLSELYYESATAEDFSANRVRRRRDGKTGYYLIR